eukprot:446157-Alexandrium_andersonii.AAC.1
MSASLVGSEMCIRDRPFGGGRMLPTTTESPTLIPRTERPKGLPPSFAMSRVLLPLSTSPLASVS